MPKCQFIIQYYNYEIRKIVGLKCDGRRAFRLCVYIFHDKNYLQDKINYEEHKRKILDRSKHKVNHAISNNEPLLCIGFQLPGFSLWDLGINKVFTEPVYFSNSQFLGKADFSEANFQGQAYFNNSEFSGKTYFSGYFNDKTKFNYVLFEGKEKIIFDIENRK
jgi:hypothetical protein